MEYNGTRYWYDKNLLGDVVGIRNASGTLVAQYANTAPSEPVARRKRATHAGEVSHAISRKKLHGKI